MGDNQGSMEVVLDAEGGLKERQSYTPWGERREGDGSTVSESGRRLGSKVRPGYTGHEMLDEVGIIHMNGRLYDPEIGRMLGPDPIVQESDNTQNYNAYSYVLNNPMRFTDPSGYSWFGKLFRSIGKFFKKIAKSIKKAFKKVRTWVKRNYKKIIVVAVAVVAIATTGWALGGLKAISTSFAKTVAFGAVSGGAMGAAQAAMAGGSWSDIFRAGVQGAVTGAIAAAAGATVLHGWGDKALNASNFGSYLGYHSLQSAGHGVVGGGLSELTGGNFKDGFIGAGFAALLSPVGNIVNSNMGFGASGTGGSLQYLGRTATAATMGGTVTAISGGKFGNGAATAAFMHVVNHEAGERNRTVGENPIHWDLPLEHEQDMNWFAKLASQYQGRAFMTVQFDPASTFEGQPGIYGQTGTMRMLGKGGEELGFWEVSSGGWATKSRLRKLGGSGSTRVQSGTFQSGLPAHGEFYPSGSGYTYEHSLHDRAFYSSHGYSFKYGVGVPGNTSILIHPISGPGTEGCIGLTSPLIGLWNFNAQMLGLVGRGGKLPLTVR